MADDGLRRAAYRGGWLKLARISQGEGCALDETINIVSLRQPDEIDG